MLQTRGVYIQCAGGSVSLYRRFADKSRVTEVLNSLGLTSDIKRKKALKSAFLDIQSGPFRRESRRIEPVTLFGNQP